MLGLDTKNITQTKWSDKTFDYWTLNKDDFRAEVQKITYQTKHDMARLRNDNWTNTVEKLGNTCIKKAPREFYGTIKKLSGQGRNSSTSATLEYNPPFPVPIHPFQFQSTLFQFQSTLSSSNPPFPVPIHPIQFQSTLSTGNMYNSCRSGRPTLQLINNRNPFPSLSSLSQY